MGYLFLDTETTGVEEFDQVWQIAWAINQERIITRSVEHTRAPSKWVLENTDYYKNCLNHQQCSMTDCLLEIYDAWRKTYADEHLYLVGAVPSFDDRLVRQSLKDTGTRMTLPWHYHLIDLETASMIPLGMAEPQTLKKTGTMLGVPPNERAHTADGDVEHLRLCFYKLLSVHLPPNVI